MYCGSVSVVFWYPVCNQMSTLQFLLVVALNSNTETHSLYDVGRLHPFL